MAAFPDIVNDCVFIETNLSFNTTLVSENNTNQTMRMEQQNLDSILDLVIIDILTPIVIIFGVFGNIVNIIVLTRRSMYSNTNCYLTTLAIYDLCYLIIVSTYYMSVWRVFRDLLPYGYYQYKVYATPIADICANTAVWLTVAFTVERYIAVYHPIKGRVLCTPKRARWIILATCVIVFLLLIPGFFENKVNCAGNATERTVFSEQPEYSIGYNWGIVVTFFAVIPLLLVSIFNTLLIRSVWKASKARTELGNSNEARRQKDEQKITVVLIAIVVAFFCLHTPNAVALLYYTYIGTTSEWNPDEVATTQLAKVHTIVNFLALINSAINFVLYSYLSSVFRKQFNRILSGNCFNANGKEGTNTLMVV